jgi:type IV secretory pathway TrbD component
MPLFFLMTLVTGVITGYLFKRNDDEITYIAGILTAVIFIVSLVLAPWQIQFGLLMFVVIVSNKLLKKNWF